MILNVFLPSARNVVDDLCERTDRKIMGDPAGQTGPRIYLTWDKRHR